MARSKNPRPLTAEQKARVEAADYEQGFAKPPAETQFKKGESGNPSGRPRRKSMRTLLKDLLDQQVSVNFNGQPQSVSVREALVQIAGSHSLKGGAREREYLFRLIAQHLPEEFQEETERSVTPEQSDILRRFAAQAAESPVIEATPAEAPADEDPPPDDEDWDIV